MARIGDVVLTPQGKGRIVRGRNWDKPPAGGGHWVFLLYPADITNRLVLCQPSEIRIVKG